MSRPSSTSPLHRGSSSTESWLSSSISDHDQRSAQTALRSSPIAIIRNSSNEDPRRSRQDDSDDEDDIDSSNLQERMSQLTVGSMPTRAKQSGWSARSSNMARSMPSVPRAPFLTSQRQVQRMPPNMSLPNPAPEREMAASLQSYGSLRESHMQGRFLDGPASYRDPSSGQIHRIARKRTVRFDDSATSYQHPSSMSPLNVGINGDTTMSSWSRQPITVTTPGERMQEARKQRQQDEDSAASGGTSPASDTKASPKETSSLSAMMQHAPKEETHVGQKGGNLYHCGGLNDDRQELEEQNVLSTSLTGLELLQKSSRNGLHVQQAGQAYSLSAVGALDHAANLTPWEPSTVGNTEPPLLDENEEEEENEFPMHNHPETQFDLDHNPDTQEAFDLDLDD